MRGFTQRLDFVSQQAQERAEERGILTETIAFCLSDSDDNYRDKRNTVFWKDLSDGTRVKVSICLVDGESKIVNAIIVGKEVSG